MEHHVFWGGPKSGVFIFFSMGATYKMNKSKWSTYYKNAEHIFINKIYWGFFLQYILMCLAYPHEAILHNTIDCVHFVIAWLYSEDLHWLESARVLMSCDLPTVPLRSTVRWRSTYWTPLPGLTASGLWSKEVTFTKGLCISIICFTQYCTHFCQNLQQRNLIKCQDYMIFINKYKNWELHF